MNECEGLTFIHFCFMPADFRLLQERCGQLAQEKIKKPILLHQTYPSARLETIIKLLNGPRGCGTENLLHPGEV
eukprot:6204597-Pleurochrysis_carterae.AAC.3